MRSVRKIKGREKIVMRGVTLHFETHDDEDAPLQKDDVCVSTACCCVTQAIIKRLFNQRLFQLNAISVNLLRVSIRSLAHTTAAAVYPSYLIYSAGIRSDAPWKKAEILKSQHRPQLLTSTRSLV